MRFAVVLCRLIIVLMAAAASSSAHALGGCSDPDYLRGFDPRLVAPVECTEIARVPVRWSGKEATLRVMKAADASIDQSNEIVSWLREGAGRIGAALEQMGPGIDLFDTTILVTALSQESTAIGGLIDAWTRVPDGECQITTYVGGIAPSADYSGGWLNVFAHELFHCVQFATWPVAAQGAERLWWMEGSAEYFTYLAFPPGDEYFAAARGWVQQFHSNSPTSSLLDLTYENVVFFSWLGGETRPARVSEFLSAMRPGGRDDQIAAAAAGLSEEGWMEFGKAYFDRRISLPGGLPLPGIPETIDVRFITEATRQSFFAEPLVLQRAEILYLPGKFETVVEADSGRHAARLFDGREWSGLPPSTEIECGEQTSYQFAAISVSPDGLAVDAEFRTLDDESVCDRCGGDSARRVAEALPACIVDSWVVDRERVPHPSKLGISVYGTTSELDDFSYSLLIRDDSTYTEQLSYANRARTPSIMNDGEDWIMTRKENSKSYGVVCKQPGDNLEFIGIQQRVSQTTLNENVRTEGTGLLPSRSSRAFYCGPGYDGAEPPMPYPVNIGQP